MATITHTEDYAVVRYDSDVDIHLRVHKDTLGEVGGRWLDYESAVDYIDQHPAGCLMHVEERSTTWTETVEDQPVVGASEEAGG